LLSLASALHGVEAQTIADETEVFPYLGTAVDALNTDAGESLPEKARAMEDEAEPVEERLHGRRYLVRVIRGCEDDSIGRHELLDEQVPIVLQRTVLLAFVEAQLAAPLHIESIAAEGHDFIFDATEGLQIFQELQHRIVSAPLAGSTDDCGDFLHVASSCDPLSVCLLGSAAPSGNSRHVLGL